uniref:Cysteine protease, putative n=1 Tax=Theileria annulata TaxID=5874 RepID=A0A3B0N351_THEAN
MEFGYNSIFVKKYSHGNSFALENDLKNKKFKLRFNSYSVIFFCVVLLFSFLVCLLVVYSPNPEPRNFKNNEYVKPIYNAPKFHEDKYLGCVKDINDKCLNYDELKLKYLSTLEEKLKLRGIHLTEVDTFDCNSPENGTCKSNSKVQGPLSKKELEAIVMALLDKNIELDEKFETDTIIEFKSFLKRYLKTYKDLNEYKARYLNFRVNRIFIETHNSNLNKLYTMGYTTAADNSDQELGRAVNSSIKYKPTDEELYSRAALEMSGPRKYKGVLFDWREKGVILPVHDQKECGSCWAFSMADLVSAMMAINGHKLQNYSKQQLMDCIEPMYTCNEGGRPSSVISYLKNYRYCTEEEYPYKMGDYRCIQPNTCKNKINISKVHSLHDKIVEDYLEKTGPFQVSIHVSKEMSFYKEGIFDGECSQRENHSVVVVGHGYDPDLKVYYWIVKNSWGEDWGENGYMRLLNANYKQNGITSYYCKLDRRSIGFSI